MLSSFPGSCGKMTQGQGKPTLPWWSWGAALLGETWPADGHSCSCLCHNTGFLTRKHYPSYSQSLSDLHVSCRTGSLHSPPHAWLWAQPAGTEGGAGGAQSPLASHPTVWALLGSACQVLPYCISQGRAEEPVPLPDQSKPLLGGSEGSVL